MRITVQKTAALVGALTLIAAPFAALARHTPVVICQDTNSKKYPYEEVIIDDNALPAHLAKGALYPVPEGGCPGPLAPAAPSVVLLIDPELYFTDPPYLAPLSWGSINASTCEGAAVQNFPVFDPPWTAPNFVGPQPTAGTVMINFDGGAGWYTFTLTCTGTDGTTATSTSVEVFTLG